MTKTKRIVISTIFSSALIGFFVTPAEAASPSLNPTPIYQIVLDTGGGGGEGSNLPGVRWTFAETPKGKPFIFWGWSTND